ncbi:hypothetical protein ACHWQZ_G001237 [Mnemiopsis leidyi]
MATFKQSEDYDYSEYLIPHGTINGVAIPFFTTPEFRLDLRQNFKLRPESDIFIVTYPKSGTTWMQNILREMLFAEEKGEWADLPLTDRVPWLDHIRDMSVGDLERLPNPRVFKCHNHSPQEMDELFFKGDKTPRIIYVLRDPRDVSVSLFYNLQKAGKTISDWMTKASFTDFFKTYFRDEKVVFYGPWEKHVENWLSARHEYNILVVRYEDLIADSSKEIARIATFIGWDCSAERVREIADKTSFASVTKEKLFKVENGVSDSFLRKGVVGDWENHFVDVEDEKLMREIAEELFKKHGV